MESLPVRGAWIEIAGGVSGGYYIVSLPVRGAWIEIYDSDIFGMWPFGRSP